MQLLQKSYNNYRKADKNLKFKNFIFETWYDLINMHSEFSQKANSTLTPWILGLRTPDCLKVQAPTFNNCTSLTFCTN